MTEHPSERVVALEQLGFPVLTVGEGEILTKTATYRVDCNPHCRIVLTTGSEVSNLLLECYDIDEHIIDYRIPVTIIQERVLHVIVGWMPRHGEEI